MIVCEHHETAHCLDVEGEIRIDDQTGEVVSVIEHYQCTVEGLEGWYHWIPGEEKIKGSVIATDERPRTMCDAGRRGGVV